MTMVLQHLDRSSIHPNEQLHEFQIVHALITQCRKQVACEDSESNCGVYENLSPPRDLKERCNPVDRSDKTSFVNTIRQTFNALAQATNPSLCAKQNVAHPVSIASTVKNIISQFSRQTCHGSLYLSSPCRKAVPKSNTQGEAEKKATDQSPKINGHKCKRTENEVVPEPSTSQRPVIERTEVKSATVIKQQSNAVATKPKTRLVRSRNSNGLVRHESTPLSLDHSNYKTVKKTTSVKRSKSDAVCYQTRSKRNGGRIDSNVQTKVLHFEKCCKASMCVECRKRCLEDTTKLPHPSVSLTELRGDSIIPKEESFMGALSYHKPSTISQNAVTVTTELPNDAASDVPLDIGKSIGQVAVKTKAIVCPGGTYFPNSECSDGNAIPSNNNMDITEGATKDDKLNYRFQEDECAYAKTSDWDANEQKKLLCNNIESNLEGVNTPEDCEKTQLEIISLDKTTSLNNMDTDDSGVDSKQCTVINENANLYMILCRDENLQDSLEDLSLTIGYDSSDNFDSNSSSSGESSLSPRQEYIGRRNGLEPPGRRAPSARYKKIRRKLKKLITRSKPCSEPIQDEVIRTQAEREQEFLSSLRIPTPRFMLSDTAASFDVKREQLAMHFGTNTVYMERLPDHVLVQIFSYLDTRSLATLKCLCTDFNFLINSYDIRGTDSLWIKDKRYMDDPCRFCRKKFTSGDVSMCRYHAKNYHCDLPYGRSYWMCCFQIEKNSPGCKTGIHDNHWAPLQQTP